jgi:hypothetical protein
VGLQIEVRLLLVITVTLQAMLAEDGLDVIFVVQ